MGPVQMLVVGFDDTGFTGEILPELTRLKDLDVIRLVDLLFVRKNDVGDVDILQQSDLDAETAIEFGAVVGGLVGLGLGTEEAVTAGARAGAEALEDGHLFEESEAWYVADAIPPGGSAAIALIEHRWAIPLREMIERAGGVPLADEWVHPRDLIAVGAAARADVPRAEV
jgi:uncharacterized membrane protein